MYKVAYENYLLRNGATWDLMTEKQKSQMLTNAHSAGNKRSGKPMRWITGLCSNKKRGVGNVPALLFSESYRESYRVILSCITMSD